MSLLTATSMRFVREILLRHSVLLIAEDADCIGNYQILALFEKIYRFIPLRRDQRKITESAAVSTYAYRKIHCKHNPIVDPRRLT